MNKKHLLSKIVIVFCLGGLIFFAQEIYNNSIQYEKVYTQIVTKSNNNSTIDFLGNLFKSKGSSNKPLDMKKLYYEKSISSTYSFVIFLCISLLGYFILNKLIFIIYLHLASLIALIYGVLTPVFLIFVHKDFGFGDITLEFSSNSIISSIDIMFSQDNYFVGSIILLFSIIFPLFKTILSLILNIFTQINNLHINKISNKLLSISKWSMSDVFVLAIFLVYLSPKKGGFIESELQMGFYLFLTYVILSMIIFVVSSKKKES